MYLESENTYFLYFTDDPDNDVYARDPQRYFLISPKTAGCELLSKREAVAYLQGKNQAIEQLRGYSLLAPSGAERRVDASSVSSNSQIILDLQAGEKSLLDPGDVPSSRLPHQEGNPFSAQFSAEEAVGGSESDAGQIFSQGEHVLMQDEGRVSQSFTDWLPEEDNAFADPNFLNPYLISLNGDGSRSSPVSNLLKSWNQRQSFLTNEADLDLSSFDYMLSDINNPYNCQTGLVNSFLRDNDDFMNLHSSSVSEIHLKDAKRIGSGLSKEQKATIKQFIKSELELGPN